MEGGQKALAKYEAIYPGGPKIWTGPGAYKLSTDSVLLGDFIKIKHAKRGMDLGCGAGILMLLVGAKNANIHLEGIEIDKTAAEICQDNLNENQMTQRASLYTEDLRMHRSFLEAGAYDIVFSNPPYFEQGSGYVPPTETRHIARQEACCTLNDLCTAAGYLCKWGGRFFLVYRPERLSTLFCAMQHAGIEPKRLRMVCNKPSDAPSLILVEGRRGGKPGLQIEPNLYLAEADGTMSSEYARIAGKVRAER